MAGATYSGSSFDLTTIGGGNWTGQWWKPDGTRLFVATTGGDKVHQINLSTPWDISSAADSGHSLDVSGKEISPQGVTFNDDGTRIYVTGFNSNSVHEYSLSAAYDLNSTQEFIASYDFFTNDGIDNPTNLIWIDGGNKALVSPGIPDGVYQFSAATPYRVSTLSYDNKVWDHNVIDVGGGAIVLGDSASSLVMVGLTNDRVYNLILGSATDVETLEATGVSFDYTGQDTHASGIGFNSDFTKMFLTGRVNGKVFEYDM